MAKYMIPFAILAPDIQARNSGYMASQRDIAPTILQLLGLPVPDHFSGLSLLEENSENFTDFYHQGLLGWVVNETLYQMPLKGNRLDCYQLGESPLQPVSRECSEPDRARNREAVAFTHLSQALLFNGEIGHFPALIKAQAQ
jgi:phosphoglycerol transferase MdoB-like AlkP superfamily enzyme